MSGFVLFDRFFFCRTFVFVDQLSLPLRRKLLKMYRLDLQLFECNLRKFKISSRNKEAIVELETERGKVCSLKLMYFS